MGTLARRKIITRRPAPSGGRFGHEPEPRTAPAVPIDPRLRSLQRSLELIDARLGEIDDRLPGLHGFGSEAQRLTDERVRMVASRATTEAAIAKLQSAPDPAITAEREQAFEAEYARQRAQAERWVQRLEEQGEFGQASLYRADLLGLFDRLRREMKMP